MTTESPQPEPVAPPTADRERAKRRIQDAFANVPDSDRHDAVQAAFVDLYLSVEQSLTGAVQAHALDDVAHLAQDIAADM